jgi:hypothetical protein
MVGGGHERTSWGIGSMDDYSQTERRGTGCEKISALSQQEALKGPLSQFNGIGHSIPSERPELLIDGSFEF